jgi:hypothetical protein
MSVTDVRDYNEERDRANASLFGIDLGVQDKRIEVVETIVMSEPEHTIRRPRTLTDRLAEAAADRVRWGRSE